MPTCQICGNHSVIMTWDFFRRCCGGCASLKKQSLSYTGDLFDEPCPKCGKNDLYATTAPALATVRTRYGPQPSKIAPGLFLLGCPDCGHAFLKFNREGARAITETSGWFNPELIRKLAND